ncbi:MAG TPA: chromosomal replication initiator protein DnaA, partial [Thiotrichaceae bacterium]|nr:chromosomal replication initiator protein DnaA [Thiotrichaceae bacterium]
MSKIWNQCKAHLKKTQTLQVFSIWINKIQAEQVGNNLSLITPNEAVQNYIKNNLQKEIIKI